MRRLPDACWIFLRGEEVPGIYAYALGRRGEDIARSLSERQCVERIDLIPLEDEWSVTCVIVRVDEGADDAVLLATFESLARGLIDVGAVAVWFGGESSTWNPGILDPSRAYGDVLAVSVTGSGLFVAPSDSLNRYLDNSVLRDIWEELVELGLPEDCGAGE